ncbi:hypothetical protein ACFL5Z_17820 [Planctomycetota bacterium]
MADYVPFVNNKADCRMLVKEYKDADICRVSLESIEDFKSLMPPDLSIWLDPNVDAFHHRLTKKWPDKPKREWTQRQRKLWKNLEILYADFSNYELLCDKKNWKQDNYDKIELFVTELLNHCYEYRPKWLTVPQLPLVDSGSRNKINKMLASATRAWKAKVRFTGRLILPLIFTNQRQINSKPIRDDKLNHAVESYDEAEADGIWIVDSTLLDQTRNDKYSGRYSKLIEFHELIKNELPKGTIKIGGPYWGINLILWARGLCDRAAISLGSRYAYYISADVPNPPSSRIAIPPLRRWVVINEDLRTWIEKSLQKLDVDDQAHKHLQYIQRKFDLLKSREASRKYTAQFYKYWFDRIASCPPNGRALALYQDLSTAFVVGSQLPNLPLNCLPNSPAYMGKAGIVAKQLMLNCL